jgi:hypothetical protein
MTIEEVDVKSAMLQSHYSFLPLVWPHSPIGHLGEGAPRSPTKILQFYSPEGGPKWPIGPCGQPGVETSSHALTTGRGGTHLHIESSRLNLTDLKMS